MGKTQISHYFKARKLIRQTKNAAISDKSGELIFTGYHLKITMEISPKIVYSVFVSNLVSSKIKFIDLFCGCGGFTKGFSEAGFSSAFGIDVWKDAAVTYKHNFPESVAYCGDIKELSGGKIFELTKLEKGDIPLIIGGPPCQGFSVAGKRIVDDERNKLYKSFVRLVNEIKPKIFVMENVPNILSIGGGIVRESVLKDFTEIGYNVSYKILTASDYGVPQARRRAFFVGLSKDVFGEEKFEFPESQNTCVTSLVMRFRHFWQKQVNILG